MSAEAVHDRNADFTMCARRDMPAMYVYGPSGEAVAISRAAERFPVPAAVWECVRGFAALHAADGDWEEQFVEDRRFVRVVALRSLGCLVVVEPLRSRPSIGDVSKRFGLTARESQILERLVRAERRSAIARALEIAESTVQSHILNIGVKMHCSRREQIIACALGAG